MSSFVRVLGARLRGFLRPAVGARELDEELAIHLDMATEDKMRQGLSEAEARRLARVELGNVTLLRETGAELRGLPWITTSWLDMKLGLRMLRKSWGLTLVAGFAMTVVIALAAVVFDVVATFTTTDLPLEDGERIVALQIWDVQQGDGLGAAPRDFDQWREELRSISPIGAFRHVERNLQLLSGAASGTSFEDGEDRPALAVAIAEVTASAFEVARVAPVLGRYLAAEDELASAEPVLVIGSEVWGSLFDFDPQIVGRTVRVDGRVHTIVGVMPEGFGFPVFHRYWTALRENPSGSPGNEDMVVFGRLADGMSIEQAALELRRVGRLESGPRSLEPHETELRVVPYVKAFVGDVPSWLSNVIAIAFALLLIPPCVNVAILVYARTVNRQGELAARYVLGASRARIIAQLFVEILVLATVAGGVGLTVARLVVWRLIADLRDRGDSLPFWLELGLSLKTLFLVAGLVVVAATVAGAIPALRATGQRVQTGLRSLSGHSRPRLGVLWTALVVLQVAFSFALLPLSVELTWGTLRSGLLGPGFAAEEILTAKLELGGSGPTTVEEHAARFEDRQVELVQRLAGDPGIASVSVLSEAPGEGPWVRVDSEHERPPERSAFGISIGTGRLSRVNHVDRAFLETFDLPILIGRAFERSDFEASTDVVIVNRSFVETVLGGASPLGRRIRYRLLDDEPPAFETPENRWFEIVGVTSDLHRHSREQTIYHAAPPTVRPTVVTLVVRTRTDPTLVAGTLREATWTLDRSLRITEIRRLDEIYRQKAVGNVLGASGLVAATVSVLLLSAAGLYALLSFTVDRRRKEIGIRSALGAHPRRLLAGVFADAFAKVGLGAAAGIAVASLIDFYVPVAEVGGWELPGIIPAAAIFMVGIAALALIGPARRALRVEPIDELRQG